MRSLVLGGSTFVGRRLVLDLVGRGGEVTVLNRGRTRQRAARRCRAGSSPTAPTPRAMRAALDGTEWDAVYDVSGFVMVAGGSPIGELLALFDGRVGAYVFVSSIMAYAPSPLLPWTEDRPDVHATRLTKYGGFKAFAESEILRRHADHRLPGLGGTPGGDLRAGQQHPRHGDGDVPAAAPRVADPACRTAGWSPATTGTSTTCAPSCRAWPTEPRAAGEVVNATGEAITSAGYVRGARRRSSGSSRTSGCCPRRRATRQADRCSRTCSTPGTTRSCRRRRRDATSGCRSNAASSPGTARPTSGSAARRSWTRRTRLSDPVWGAGYDFAAEARVAAAL